MLPCPEHERRYAIVPRVGLTAALLARAARGTPAAYEDSRTVWWFRYSDNSTWWSSAVLAHGPADDLAGRIDAAERFYAERGAPTHSAIGDRYHLSR